MRSVIFKFWLGQWSKYMCRLLSWTSVEGEQSGGEIKNFSNSVLVAMPLKWVCLCVCDIFLEINMKKYGKGKERIGKRIGTE